MLAYIAPGTSCLIGLPLIPRLVALAATLAAIKPILVLLRRRWPGARRATAIGASLTALLAYGLLSGILVLVSLGELDLASMMDHARLLAASPDWCAGAAAVGGWLLGCRIRSSSRS